MTEHGARGAGTLCFFLRPVSPAGARPASRICTCLTKSVVCPRFGDRHRLLHHKLFYARFHKQHHTYAASVSYAAEYAHPVEIVLSNYAPTLAGLLVTAAHPLVILGWIAIRLLKTYEAHSGYCFRGSWFDRVGLSNPEAAAWHDYHHTGNRGNFGAAYLDWLFGTMDAFAALGGVDGYLERKPGWQLSYLDRLHTTEPLHCRSKPRDVDPSAQQPVAPRRRNLASQAT